ncbi:MAG: hypothetical protein LWX83_15240 [Anaerolineae bacterium]|nr:hypothetical protein [Anaerolineae bacterium]
MDRILQHPTPMIDEPDYQQAWDLVVSQLRMDMTQGLFDTWVQPLTALGYTNHAFIVGAKNPYARDWVQSRLKDRIERILEGFYSGKVTLQVEVLNGLYKSPRDENPITGLDEENNEREFDNSLHVQPKTGQGEKTRNRKVMLQKAYGSRRAAVIQPERGMFVTMYFFSQWLPLIGHSAFTVILAARSMCFWNPMTGELRNTIETDMTELATRAAVSVRTVKDILKNELVRRYFLRYRARRIMTPNGVRTAGITLQVRMDDPLTPHDQDEYNLPEEDHWYTDEFEDFEEE